MSDHLIDVRTPLALSKNTRVEVGEDGVLHVLVGPVTVHMDRPTCEELTSTMARALIQLASMQPKRQAPNLSLVGQTGLEPAAE